MVKKWVDNYRLCQWQEPKRSQWRCVSVFDVRKKAERAFGLVGNKVENSLQNDGEIGF